MIGMKPRSAFALGAAGVTMLPGLAGCHTNTKIADNYPDAPKEKPAFKATYTIVNHGDGTGGCKAIPTTDAPSPQEVPCSGAILGNTAPEDKENAAKDGVTLFGIGGNKLAPNDYYSPQQPASRGGTSRGPAPGQ